jgi:hypothetical protein
MKNLLGACRLLLEPYADDPDDALIVDPEWREQVLASCRAAIAEAEKMTETRDPPYMPMAVCRLCMGPDPKARRLSHGLYEIVCDRCWPNPPPETECLTPTQRRIINRARRRWIID